MSGRPAAVISDVVIVIVTYNRPALLELLLDSIIASALGVSAVVIVDNGSERPTVDIVDRYTNYFSDLGISLFSVRLEVNAGGAGGFHEGLKRAICIPEGSWFWLMDDDVEVVAGGLQGLLEWTDRYDCIHGRRCESDGKPFHWQPKFNEVLALPLPTLGDVFANTAVFETNCGCFEGMLVSRSAVETVGLPDSRFFITWDDAVYGWMISRVGKTALVNVLSLRRLRQQRQISLLVRHLNDSNDVSRYYVMRNRAIVRQYWREGGVLSPVGFAVGTFLTFGKELIKVFVVERRPRGIIPLIRGSWDSIRFR